MIDKADITIVIPAYNEGSVIHSVIERVHDNGYANVIVINDGSKDNTLKEARRAGATVVSHPINRGAGAAAQTGLQYARKHNIQYLVQIDADGQHYPEDIDKMASNMMEQQSDIVIGSRWIERSEGVPGTRIAYNQLSNIFTNFFCKNKYTDSQSGMRLLNRKAIEKINLHLDGFGYCSEMLVHAEAEGLIISEVPIRVAYTEYSMSKGQDLQMGITTAINLLWKLIFHPPNQ
jgi:glycosyltransferase involved in cell wall biosynthesis